MKSKLLAGLVPLALSMSALGAERPQDRWSLSDLYPNVQAWNADVAKTEAQLKQFASCRGHYDAVSKRMNRIMDEIEAILARRAKS